MNLIRALLLSLAVMALVAPAAAETLRLEAAQVRVADDPWTRAPILIVTLTPQSGDAFADFTTRHVGAIAEVSVGGKVVVAPLIQSPIPGGELHIAGSYTRAELDALLERIGSKKAMLVVRTVRP